MSGTKLNPLNGHLWLVVRWVVLTATVLGYYHEMDKRLDRIEYRMGEEFVTKEGFRAWRDDLQLHNAPWRVPEAKLLRKTDDDPR